MSLTATVKKNIINSVSKFCHARILRFLYWAWNNVFKALQPCLLRLYTSQLTDTC